MLKKKKNTKYEIRITNHNLNYYFTDFRNDIHNNSVLAKMEKVIYIMCYSR